MKAKKVSESYCLGWSPPKPVLTDIGVSATCTVLLTLCFYQNDKHSFSSLPCGYYVRGYLGSPPYYVRALFQCSYVRFLLYI